MRPALFAFRALNVELACLKERAPEHADLGVIRAQWWRDALAAADDYAAKSRGHGQRDGGSQGRPSFGAAEVHAEVERMERAGLVSHPIVRIIAQVLRHFPVECRWFQRLVDTRVSSHACSTNTSTCIVVHGCM